MIKKFLILFFILCTIHTVSESQITWSASLGGGFAHVNDYFRDNLHYNFQGSYFIEGGIMIGSSFRKEGIMSWQTGVSLHSGGIKFTPVDDSNVDPDEGINIDNIKWDWENTTKYKNWSVNIPFSFLFDVFAPVGLIFGPHITYTIDSGMDDFHGTKYKKWTPGGHLGLYAPIGKRFKVIGQMRSDVPSRLTDDEKPFSVKLSYRELAYFLQLNYQLKP